MYCPKVPADSLVKHYTREHYTRNSLTTHGRVGFVTAHVLTIGRGWGWATSWAGGAQAN